MIKEITKKTKYNSEKTTIKIVCEYFRTILCSIFVAMIITGIVAIHARNEMIKNFSADNSEQLLIDKKVALDIISKTDLLENLENKNFSYCMYVGDIYETVGDYKNAQVAYELAIKKSKQGLYGPYYKLIEILVKQEKFEIAENILLKVSDVTDKKLIKFKTRAYLAIGDKYYSIGKFLSAAKSYERAAFYYNKFCKKDSVISSSIDNRIVAAYINVADIMVHSNKNYDAIRFLKKAETYSPNDLKIQYKLAIILADSDPEKSVQYFDKLLDKIPQDIDYRVYTNALIKAANIADLDNRPTKAKYYRYKIHSIDLFVNRKVVYRDDIETLIRSFNIKKGFFTYHLKAEYLFTNMSNVDIIHSKVDFILCNNNKPIETVTKIISDKNNPLFSLANQPNKVDVEFRKKIFTEKELENYTVKIYVYKDSKYKTLVYEHKLPKKSF